jgi:hypothetical protein
MFFSLNFVAMTIFYACGCIKIAYRSIRGRYKRLENQEDKEPSHW